MSKIFIIVTTTSERGVSPSFIPSVQRIYLHVESFRDWTVYGVNYYDNYINPKVMSH